MTVVADPKPRRRYRASQAEWEQIHLHFTADLCWLCGQAHDDLHHVLPRSQSGDDAIGNLVPVCNGCHRRLHAGDPWARSALRLALRPRNTRYLEDKLGERWLAWVELKYPHAKEAHRV